MHAAPQTRAGFTLVEMMIALAIFIIAIALSMSGYVYIWSESNKSGTQDELDVAVQLSIEKLKRDLRLSSLDKMYYFPFGPGPYSAISMPLARDDDGDGAIDIDADGKIIWDKTVIYHVWSGNPSQLRKTTFDPRDNGITVTQMQAQLNSVATVGNGSSTYGSSNATTEVVFQNLFTWSVKPQSSTYDGYATETERDLGVVLGTAILSNGNHTLQFRIIEKNPDSSGYKLGLDTLFMSPSAGEREAEAQLPATAVVGATIPTNVYMSAGSWSGNYHLSFPATATNRSFTLTMPSDRWEETNFRTTGDTHEDTTVLFDTSLTPSDFILLLDGNITNWSAAAQTADTNPMQAVSDNFQGCAVRVLLRGKDIDESGYILSNGGRCQINFCAGNLGNLRIEDTFIAEAQSTNTLDAVPGTMTRLRFSGSEGVAISGGGNAWSDLTTFNISKQKSYLLSFLVNNGIGNGSALCWAETNTAGYVGAYVVAASSSPTEADTMANTWSTRTDVSTTNVIPALRFLFTTYPTNGVYTSAIFNTQSQTPPYSNMTWSTLVPSGAAVGFKVRTANSNDMSDATAWTNIATLTSGTINPGNKRYVQFRTTLQPTTAGTETPKVRDVRINWAGATEAVDVGGTFTKGPDYGIFEVLVNGQPLKKGVLVNLEIFDFARAHGTSNRITSAATAEVTPRNTGR